MRKILLILVLWVTAQNVTLAQPLYLTSPGNFGQLAISYSPSENILYSGTSRYRVTSTVEQSHVQALVNGDYDQTAITVPEGESTIITIDFLGKGGAWVRKPDGYLFLNFFEENYPDSVTAVIYDSTDATADINAEDWSNQSNTSPYILLRAQLPSGFAGLKKIEIRIKSRSEVVTKISELEYILTYPGQFERGIFTKWDNNTIWSDLTVKDTGNVQRAYITNTGIAYLQKLGIGTTNTNDTAKLFVEGQIRARQVKVDEELWPDYVFAKDYKLPSIQQLHEYIKKNNHLPGIPSAEEVKTKGLDVGKNQAALMEKIEELTLYLIQQKNMLDAQQKEIDKLKKCLRQKKKIK